MNKKESKGGAKNNDITTKKEEKMNADITYALRRHVSTIQHHKETCMFVQKEKLVEKIERSLQNVHR